MKKIRTVFLFLIIFLLTGTFAHAESLFLMGVTQNSYAIEPHSLYSGVKARSVGDLITVVLEESYTSQDELTYNADRTANTVNNFTNLINGLLPGKPLTEKVNNFGGSNTVESTTKNNRNITYKNSITAQVVQLMPNGNLVIQGKKTLISTNERVDVLMSGVVDPRWINETGQVSSKNVANLQFAMNGSGSVSRSGGEGIINRFIRYLF